jgi:hypothetical protein
MKTDDAMIIHVLYNTGSISCGGGDGCLLSLADGYGLKMATSITQIQLMT